MSASLRPLKVLLLSRWLWEENRRSGGNGTTQELAQAVASLGHEVVALSQSPDVAGLQKSQIGTLETWLTPREKRRFGLTWLRDKLGKQQYKHRKIYSDVLDLRDFLKQRGPFDVLWAQAEEPDGLLAAIAAQERVPVPPIVTQIQALRYVFVQNEQRFSDQASLGKAFAFASIVLANSEMVARDIFHHYAEETGENELRAKTHILHHNLTATFIETAQNMVTQVLAEKSRVLFLGALNEKKGPLVFLESLPYCAAASSSGVTFAIIGDFTEENPEFAARWEKALQETREKLGALSKSLTIELLGKLKSEQVLHQIKRATVVVMPSLYDEFSRAIAEALASGRPVITTDKVGASQLITAQNLPTQTTQDEADTTWEADESAPGIVVRSNDARMLGWAISSALDPYAPQAENARRMAPEFRKQFSPDAIARKLTNHFQNAVRGPLPTVRMKHH